MCAEHWGQRDERDPRGLALPTPQPTVQWDTGQAPCGASRRGSVCLAWVSGWKVEARLPAADTPREPGGQGGGRHVLLRL